ncbi:hypothetical protein DNTS_023924 [Danionella cerebrum]|uniref:Uncharacterized protein n=1 Tax=Danionella cerebrum TaxID=2873325 RepID=A0A553MUZ3_9TELE|nr:hypothetical protein DNTS_023924 [Danionella translucida]
MVAPHVFAKTKLLSANTTDVQMNIHVFLQMFPTGKDLETHLADSLSRRQVRDHVSNMIVLEEGTLIANRADVPRHSLVHVRVQPKLSFPQKLLPTSLTALGVLLQLPAFDEHLATPPASANVSHMLKTNPQSSHVKVRPNRGRSFRAELRLDVLFLKSQGWSKTVSESGGGCATITSSAGLTVAMLTFWREVVVETFVARSFSEGLGRGCSNIRTPNIIFPPTVLDEEEEDEDEDDADDEGVKLDVRMSRKSSSENLRRVKLISRAKPLLCSADERTSAQPLCELEHRSTEIRPRSRKSSPPQHTQICDTAT